MTTIEKECVLIASIFDNPTGRFGESLCTALAHWEWWESVEAKLLAEAIRECLDDQKVPSRSFVRAKLPRDLGDWPFNPVFGPDNALSLELADHEAASLLPIYRNKRIAGVIARAHGVIVDNPESAERVAKTLVLALEGV